MVARARLAHLRALPGGLASPPAADARRFGCELLAGRFVELSGVGAPLTSVALRLVREAQQRGENVAWITLWAGTLYAPDAALAGVDLAALPVVVARGPSQASPASDAVGAAGRAVSHLMRSGAFGLVVLDLVAAPDPDLPTPLQSRLVGLAQKHGTALVALTRKKLDQPSLGSLVSLHATVARGACELGADGNVRVAVTVTATKDKRHGPGWSHTEHYRGPDGLA